MRLACLLALALAASAQNVRLKARVVDASTGAGIPGASVHVYEFGPGSGHFDRLFPVDPNGVFETDVPSPGSFAVEPRAAGYLPVAYSIVNLKAETTPPTLTLRINRVAAVKGKVIDEDTGEPIPSIQVGADSASWYRGRRDVLPGEKTTLTASDGTFLLTGLSAAEYVLQLNNPLFDAGKPSSGPNEQYPRTFWPGGDRDTVSPFPVPPGSTLNVGAVRLRKQKLASLMVRVAGGNCTRGQSYDAELTAYSGHAVFNFARVPVPCGGAAVIPHTSPGEYILRASATWGPDGAREQGAQTVRMADRDTEVSVPVTLPLTIHGKVMFDKPELLRVKLWPRGSDEGALISPLSSADTVNVSPDGSFSSYAYVPPGGAVLAIVSGLPRNAYVEKVSYNGVATAGNIFSIDPLAARQELAVICSEGARGISGRVEPGASVLLVAWPPRLVSGYPSDVVERTGDGAGNYSFFGLRPGSYRVIAVEASDRQLLEQPGKLMPLFSGAETIELQERSSATADLKPAAVR